MRTRQPLAILLAHHAAPATPRRRRNAGGASASNRQTLSTGRALRGHEPAGRTSVLVFRVAVGAAASRAAAGACGVAAFLADGDTERVGTDATIRTVLPILGALVRNPSTGSIFRAMDSTVARGVEGARTAATAAAARTTSLTSSDFQLLLVLSLTSTSTSTSSTVALALLSCARAIVRLLSALGGVGPATGYSTATTC
uniref:Uncharacterized protein n=1 Tax=Anopheles darlingi TaxID=43151 RepID=A0A2M4CXK9_ANODA